MMNILVTLVDLFLLKVVSDVDIKVYRFFD